MAKTRRKRNPKKGRAGRALMFIILGGAAAWAGWKMAPAELRASAKKTFSNELSLIADRLDELAEAWESRDRHPGLTAGKKSEPKERTAKPEKKTNLESPSLKKTPAPREEPPGAEISPEDQEQLRDLLRKINQEP